MGWAVGWGGGVLLADSFHRFSGEHPGGLHKISIVLPTISARGNWMEKLVFCAIGWRSLCFALYLFVYYLFIHCLFVCLLFNYF